MDEARRYFFDDAAPRPAGFVSKLDVRQKVFERDAPVGRVGGQCDFTKNKAGKRFFWRDLYGRQVGLAGCML